MKKSVINLFAAINKLAETSKDNYSFAIDNFNSMWLEFLKEYAPGSISVSRDDRQKFLFYAVTGSFSGFAFPLCFCVSNVKNNGELSTVGTIRELSNLICTKFIERAL